MKTFMYSLIVIFCLTSVSSFAQMPFKFGAYAGISSANMDYNTVNRSQTATYDSKSGVRVGIFAEYICSPFFSFTGDLSYMQNGTKSQEIRFARQANNGMGYEDLGWLDVRHDYISFAPMVKARYECGLVAPFAAAGPNLNFLISANEQGEYESYNKMVLGYTAGVGTELNVNLPFSFMLELLYNHDLTSAHKIADLKVRNYSYAFLFGVKF